MRLSPRSSALLSRSGLCPSSTGSKPTTSGQAYQKRSVYTLGKSYDYTKLEPSSALLWFRPRFTGSAVLHGDRRSQRLDYAESMAMRNAGDSFHDECHERFKDTGLNYRDRLVKMAIFMEDGAGPGAARPADPESNAWANVETLRAACQASLGSQLSPVEDCRARKFCAQTQDSRYPAIYRSLETQAHALYLIGRVELERDIKWRTLAQYILSVSAGLGQLDAALLLHQLEKHEPKRTVQAELRAMIAKAAEEKIDWRAMVAHCEHMFTTAQGRNGKGRLQGVQLEQCLTMLEDAMSLTCPAKHDQVEREPPMDEMLDVETLEAFEAPYKLLAKLAATELEAGNQSDKVIQAFEIATQVGAIDYNDPEAAWQYARWTLLNNKDYTQDLVSCLRMAATEGNADASFQLAKYCLKRDGWSPSIAAKVLDSTNIQKQGMEEGDETEIHQAILDIKDRQLLDLQDGLYWMKLSAQLHIDSATKMLNRYCIVGGLLRQNGFLTEGRDVLLEAKDHLNNCIGPSAETKKALGVLDEFLDFWDKRLVHQLLDPDSIGRLLNPT